MEGKLRGEIKSGIKLYNKEMSYQKSSGFFIFLDNSLNVFNNTRLSAEENNSITRRVLLTCTDVMIV